MKSDFQRSKSEVLAALRDVAGIAADAGADSLAKKLRDERIPHLEEERFHLVVLGEFNHGKTTFVNALLGAPVLPAGVTPTTAVIHHIVYGKEPGATAVKADGTRIEVPIGELSEYVVGGKAQKDEVQFIEVRYPSPLLEGGVVLVDTPGVNDLNLARAEITYGYVPRADAVLFLLDAGQILKESERAFLSGKLLSQSKDKVLFVVNKIDLLSSEERTEALAYAKLNLAKLIDQPRLYPLSAQRALAGDVAGAGLAPFTSDLVTFLADERGRILLDNALDEGLRAADLLKKGIEVQRRALSLDHADLERRLKNLEADLDKAGKAGEERQARVRDALGGVKAVMRREVDAFAERFARALPGEIEQSRAEDLKKYLPQFIEERFKSFADQQGEEIARRLEQVAEEAIAFLEDDARARAQRLKDDLGPAAPALDLSVNTFAYDVGVFALGAFGIGVMALSNVLVGGAMTLAAPILAFVFRERADRELKKRAIEHAPTAVREAAGKMAEAFERQIDQFGEKLVAFVAQSSEELGRNIADVLRAASAAQSEGGDASADLERRGGMALVRVSAVESRLGQLRTALWVNGKGTGPEIQPENG